MQERRLIMCLTVAIMLPFVVLGLLLPAPSLALNVSSVTIIAANCTDMTAAIVRTPVNDDGGSGYDYYRFVISDNTGAILFIRALRAAIGSGTLTNTTVNHYNVASTGSVVYATVFEQTTYNTTDPNGAQLGSASVAVPCAPPTLTPLPTNTPVPTATPINSTATLPGPTATLPGPTATATISVLPPVLGPSYYPPERRVMASIRRDTAVYGTPDSKGPVVGKLQAGQTWFVTGVDDTGQFNEVFLGGPELGWVKAADVEMHGPLPTIPSSNTSIANGVLVGNNAIGSAVVTAYTLRIRSGPGLNNPQIGLAYQGDTYTVFARRGVWLNVSGPGGSGWVHGDWVNLQGAASPQSTARQNPPTAQVVKTGPLPGVVLAYTLRLRAGPRLSSLQVGMANQNEVYTVVGQSPGGIWLNVSGPGGSGWVDGSYLKVLGSRAQLPIMR